MPEAARPTHSPVMSEKIFAAIPAIMPSMPVIHWFRRDLRLADNTALEAAARAGGTGDGVIPLFIFDDAILKHPDCGGPIVQFMLGCLAELRGALRKMGGELIFLHEEPIGALVRIAKETGASAVYANKDYEPAAVERDEAARRALAAMKVELRLFKDQVIFEEQDILSTASGEPYTVFTPYKNTWLKHFAGKFGREGPVPGKTRKIIFAPAIRKLKDAGLPTVQSLGFESLRGMEIEPGESAGMKALQSFCDGPIVRYHETRNFPAIADGTSRLSPHLRHGTVSPRQALHLALAARTEGGASVARGVDIWISELIWREFYQQIIFNFPHVAAGAFRQKLDKLQWQFDKQHWRAWTEGKTGFPIVDAGMRQLNLTGWMHNRLRMIVAMFLTKDLLIDYKRGERYFANHLIDFETAQNNGGWQWSASTGTDAQPYFRVFNPALQSKTCDPRGAFIRRYCRELKNVPDRFIHAPHEMPLQTQKEIGCVIGKHYPAPIVEHEKARNRAIAMFRKKG